ncbi:MAG: 30S ribosomal protein S16 [Candidatus Saccharimonadales bacterium]
MLAIRMQRTGRKGHAQFRVVVQDSRVTPTSGRVVATLGSYDPHTKATTLVKDKAEFYLGNGAQPSDRVVKLFQTEGIAIPAWVKIPAQKSSAIRNTDKLRRNQPKDESDEALVKAEEAAPAAEEAPEEAPAEEEATKA